MGQTKKLLETILELEFDETLYPDDMDRDYQKWVEQRQQEQLAYEEMLADSK
jgi:DNA-binding protein H-NS